VDDNLLLRNQEAINTVTEEIKTEFDVKIEEDMKDYLGCELITSQDGR
jgi:hypothetical protein